MALSIKAFSVQRSAFSVQRSAFSVQRSAFSVQRSAFHALALSLLLLCSTVIESGCAAGAPADSSTISLEEVASITTTATANTRCSRVGELARGADGSVLRCVWNSPDLPSNGASGRP
jgi:hypothetical protein